MNNATTTPRIPGWPEVEIAVLKEFDCSDKPGECAVKAWKGPCRRGEGAGRSAAAPRRRWRREDR